MSEKTVIEVNGVKLEVDLRNARRVDTFHVGDNVKVLTKGPYESTWTVAPGVIVGFDPFKNLPTIIVASISVLYSSAEIKFHYVNAESKGIELCLAAEGDVPFERERVISLLLREIEKKQAEYVDAVAKKDLFERQFGKWFTAKEESEVTS